MVLVQARLTVTLKVVVAPVCKSVTVHRQTAEKVPDVVPLGTPLMKRLNVGFPVEPPLAIPIEPSPET